MSGIVGVVSKNDCKNDLLYATDYHSHLGTQYGGLAILNNNKLKKTIHNITKSQFKSKFFEDINFLEMLGNQGIGAISDRDAQPLVLALKFGEYALCGAGYIENQNELAKELIKEGVVFSEITEGKINQIELVGKLINKGKTLLEGIEYMFSKIEGSMSLLLLGKEGLYAVRDKYGRTPLVLAEKKDSRIVAFESCSYKNLGFKTKKFIGPGEILLLKKDKVIQLKKPGNKLQLCTFLFVYTGFPASEYEGKSVQKFREESGEILATNDMNEGITANFVAGVADSGTAYAYGYSRRSKLPIKIPLLKYTPGWSRSYTPPDQETRDKVALMKQISVDQIINGKRIILTEDSIVRGTQLKNFLINKLYNAGAREIHIRPACPALMYPCKFLLSTRNPEELFARRIIKAMKKKGKNVDAYLDPSTKEYKEMIKLMEKDLKVTSLRYQKLKDMLKATGLPESCLCTYCWNGREVK
jgi:amidophosphoribosyltransferase